MNENPYAPPRADVSDLPEAVRPLERPSQVELAVMIAAGNYVLGLIGLILTWNVFYSKLMPLSLLVVNQLFSLGFMGWIYYMVWQGKNWARILLLVFTLLGVVTLVYGPVRTRLAALPTMNITTMVISWIAHIAIFWLLFISPGRVWFQRET